MADTDLCLCGNTRKIHPADGKGLKAMGALLLDAGHVCTAGGFKLDRKATWKAERGQPVRLMTKVLNGCRLCGRRGLSLVKVQGGYAPAPHDCEGKR